MVEQIDPVLAQLAERATRQAKIKAIMADSSLNGKQKFDKIGEILHGKPKQKELL